MLKTTHPCAHAAAVPKQLNDIVSGTIPSLPPYRHEAHCRPSAALTQPFMLTAIAATCSWLRNRRIRYLFLFLCSPLLLLLLFAALPFLCAADLCLRRRFWGKIVGDDDRRCEEGCCGCGGDEEKGLLHRYLEDQLLLVGSCGDEEDEEREFEGVQDIENPGSIRTPLLN